MMFTIMTRILQEPDHNQDGYVNTLRNGCGQKPACHGGPRWTTHRFQAKRINRLV